MADLDLRDSSTGVMKSSAGTHTNNSLHVVSTDANGNVSTGDFKPSSYESRITTDGIGKTIALSSDATAVRVTNLDATNFAVVAFGTSASNAIANLTVAGAIGTTGEVILVSSEKTLGIPVLATHIALITGVNATTPILNIVQGV